jgi:hypothetical protein
MKFTIFNVTTGEIAKNVDCSESTILLQYDPLEYSHIPGEWDYFSTYIENGIPIQMPERPSEFHIFDYSIKEWVDPRTPDSEWLLVRQKRNQLLAECDWTQLPDVPLPTKEIWAIYRQELRDITLQPDPFNIIWPEQP